MAVRGELWMPPSSGVTCLRPSLGVPHDAYEASHTTRILPVLDAVVHDRAHVIVLCTSQNGFGFFALSVLVKYNLCACGSKGHSATSLRLFTRPSTQAYGCRQP